MREGKSIRHFVAVDSWLLIRASTAGRAAVCRHLTILRSHTASCQASVWSFRYSGHFRLGNRLRQAQCSPTRSSRLGCPTCQSSRLGPPAPRKCQPGLQAQSPRCTRARRAWPGARAAAGKSLRQRGTASHGHGASGVGPQYMRTPIIMAWPGRWASSVRRLAAGLAMLPPA